MDYAGLRVRQCRVIYVAAEGQGSFVNRVIAARAALELPSTGIPFKLVTVAPNLGSADGDASALIKEIKAQLGGDSAGVIVIDTVARTMAGANENSEGMAAFVDNAGQLAEAFHCLVIAVHHTGKDETRGKRGWSGLGGATDAEWEFSIKDGERKVSVSKMRDGEDGWTWGFKLNQVELAEDSDGDPVTTCVVELTSEPLIQKEAANVGHKPTGTELSFIAAFNEAIRCGKNIRVGFNGPVVLASTLLDVRREFYKRHTVGEDKERSSDAMKKAWKRAVGSTWLLRRYPRENRDGVELIWSLKQEVGQGDSHATD